MTGCQKDGRDTVGFARTSSPEKQAFTNELNVEIMIE